MSGPFASPSADGLEARISFRLLLLRSALGVFLCLFLAGALAAQQEAEEESPSADREVKAETEPQTKKTEPKTKAKEPKSKGDSKPPKPPQPYKGSAFALNDFSYLEDPKNTAPYQPFDELKRIRLGDCLRLDLGGEYRNRYHVEHNMRLRGEDNDFDLNRVRLYSDLWYGKDLRLYVEYLDAVSFGEEVAPRPTDEDRSDFLQMFADLNLTDACGQPLYLRVGREEMSYGSERLISSPDWSNVRRAYEGATLFSKGKEWDVDVFCVQPIVPVAPHNFDRSDPKRQFGGLFTTYHGVKDHVVDLYCLWLNEQDSPNGFVNSILGTPGNFYTSTLGARWQGKHDDWLWEVEGAVQVGRFTGLDYVAGMYTVGLGYSFKCLPTKPVLWAYYDFASGDADPTDNRRTTFDQLFPSGHRYLGWMDLVGRQNIHDLNFRLSSTLHEDLELVVWCHVFRLDQARDNLYNSAGRIIRASDPNGSDGTDVGQEIDVTLAINITSRVQWVLGYSHFFSGEFIVRSAPANPGATGDADFFYSQLGVRF